MQNYKSIVPYLKERLEMHHKLYSGQCKAELWEENCANALLSAGIGSDWLPDFNHFPGLDQTTDSGIAISNKGGSMNRDNTIMEISGSRLTKHKTITEKLEHLKNKSEDYIFCLATNKYEWKNGNKNYYFVVVDANKLDYHNQLWMPTYNTKTKIENGYKCIAEHYEAKITKSMSDQIWTKISSKLFEEIYKIDIEI